MGLVRGPGVIEPAGIGPYRKHLKKQVGLGPSGRILGLLILGGAEVEVFCRFCFFRWVDGFMGEGFGIEPIRIGANLTCGSLWIPIGPIWGPIGAQYEPICDRMGPARAHTHMGPYGCGPGPMQSAKPFRKFKFC